MAIDITIVAISSKNGSIITSSLYTPLQSKGIVIIAPATGIKRQFYHHFATYLAGHGYTSLTFDNDGIGDSLSGHIKDNKASLVSWGKNDLSAVFQLLRSRYPDQDIHLVGHSAGGQLIGFMEGVMQLKSVFNFACSSGSLSTMNYPFKAKAHLFMNGFIPVSNALLSYTNSPWMGMGEALPSQVAQQWSLWCNNKGYVQYHLDRNSVKHWYHDLACPSMWVHATDDDIASLSNVQDMIRVFPKLPAEITSLNPEDYGFKDIGHMKFFSRSRKELWPLALEWLQQQS